MEDLMEGETPLTDIAQEIDVQSGFSMEVRALNTFSGVIVFGYYSNEDRDAPCDEEDTKDETTEPCLHEDDETQERMVKMQIEHWLSMDI